MIWSSWISHLLAILILRYSPSKKATSFVSYCFSKPTFTHISGTKCPILLRFSAKCDLCDVLYDHVENSKLNVTDLRLILLDHITYTCKCTFWRRCKGNFQQECISSYHTTIGYHTNIIGIQWHTQNLKLEIWRRHFKKKQVGFSSCQSFVRVLNHNMYKHSRAYGINRPSA